MKQESALTDDEIDSIWAARTCKRGSILMPQLRHFAREILAGAAPPAASPVAGVEDAAFLAARLRRLFAYFKCQLPESAADDTNLIDIAGSIIGNLLLRLEATTPMKKASALEGLVIGQDPVAIVIEYEIGPT